MEVLVDFLLNNYIWFIVISLIIIFALIGYLVDSSGVKVKKQVQDNKGKIKKEIEMKDDVQIHPSVQVYTNDRFDKPLIDEKSS